MLDEQHILATGAILNTRHTRKERDDLIAVTYSALGNEASTSASELSQANLAPGSRSPGGHFASQMIFLKSSGMSDLGMNYQNQKPRIPKIIKKRKHIMPASILSPIRPANVLTSKLIKLAREHITIDERELQCLDCYLLPNMPYTFSCGHTRCVSCVLRCSTCPCGNADGKSLYYLNVLSREILRTLLSRETGLREFLHSKNDIAAPGMLERDGDVDDPLNTVCRIPITARARYEYAKDLIKKGQLMEASPQLARVAASNDEKSYAARKMLHKALIILAKRQRPKLLQKHLREAIIAQGAKSWLKESDLECVYCCDTFSQPVTTPCGHTFCRNCLERSLDYMKTCALCKHPLNNFSISVTHDTKFVVTALISIGALRPPILLDPGLIPIFECTVAFPGMPCPLLIFDPRYWFMIRRVLETGSRKFGMVAWDRNEGTFATYGTILEVRDCVHLKDGSSILSTIAISRFKIIEQHVWEGCKVARVEPVVDTINHTEFVLCDMRLLAAQISYKAFIWMNAMSADMRAEIEYAFGQIPVFDIEGTWWTTPDGPLWLWWLIAILPLNLEIRMLMLATNNLVKRMLAVSRALDRVLQMSPPDYVPYMGYNMLAQPCL